MLLLELDPQLLRKLRDEVLFNWFPRGVDYYNGLALTDYRELVTAAQDAVNDAYYNRQLAGSVKEQIYDILGSKQIMLQDGGHLRAARPIVSKLENVGWHREGMYGASPGEYNFWVPLSGVTTENSPLYIPGSDKIPDKDLTVMLAEGDPPVPANRIGLIPRPAIIVKGVDYSTAEPFKVPYGKAAFFPGSLIHGAASNRTENIRFSFDFRVCAKEKLAPDRQAYYIDLG